MTETLFAAQPIYDSRQRVVAHELLYRHENGITALEVGDSQATSEVLFNLCTGIVEHVEHFKKPVFINVASDFLMSGSFLPLNPKDVVIELVERIRPTPEIVAAIESWVSEGFQFALDDFAFEPEWEPLLHLVSVIKVDISLISIDEVKDHLEDLRHIPVQWLAERVEDEQTYNAYRDLGFDLFQGFYLARPIVIEGTKVPSAASQLTFVIEHLFAEEPDLYDLVSALSTDPLLVVNLLRIANSPYYAARRRIESLKEVVMMLGLEPLRKWVLLIISLQSTTPVKAKLVLTRAYMCSELMQLNIADQRRAGPAFLVGLLSGTDTLLGVSTKDFVSKLNITESMRDAVLHRKGELGELLASVEEFEYALAMKQPIDADNPLFGIYQQCHFLVDEMLSAAGFE
ncbi:EAL and HDOD domain-containing protein [Pseudidiomarina sp.]|uniref:EAL and HDOD domain-containing protein n=1 Tax=Pseudidiomarina sp. TaxID=2081707 RepID=UPI00299D0AC4|nr:HDOD domain-containing protein [Pseudidiomarina sp.]MDX1706207.1 HDOD domain-containing protein [Pseudidiomarina sp.]